MTRIIKSRKAVSTVVVALIAMLLLATFTAALLYLATTQMQSTSTETTEKLSEKARENLQAWLIPSSGGVLTIGVKNVGPLTSTVVGVLVQRPDGSLETINLDTPVNVPPTSSDPFASTYENVTVNVAGSYSGLAVLTTLGNTFPVQTGTVVTQPVLCTVTFYVKDAGGNTVSGATILFNGVAYSDGQTATVEAGSYALSTGTIPSSYAFSQWEASGAVAVASPTASSTTATVSGSGSITMRLSAQPQTATVTFSASGLGSDASGTVLTVDGTAYMYSQLPVTFTWAVGSSHSFEWSDPVSAGSGKQYAWVSTSGLSTSKSGSINVPSGGGSVSATYKNQYQWTFSAPGLGSDASGTVVTVDGTNYGYSSLPLTFWWDSGSSHSYSYQQYVSSSTSGKRYANHNHPSWSGTVSGSNSLNPSFHVEYQLTISVSPSGAGSTDPAPGSYWYDSGSTVSVSATPNTGYTFSYWSLEGSNVGSSNPYTVTMNTPHSLTAVFTGATYTLTVYVYKSGTSTCISGATVKVDGTPYTTGSTGAVSVTVSYGSHTVEVVSPYSPSSGTRYVFTQWSDGSTSNPRTVSVTSSTILTAYMRLQYLLSASVNPTGAGGISASPSSSDWYYDEGTSVTLTASASSGYAFDCWIGDASGTGNLITMIMNSPKTVTANFFTFSISVSPNSGSCSVGRSVSATVTVTYGSGVNSKSISLSASGMPSGASASFGPSTVTISPSSTAASSTMTITTSTSTPTGTYSITIAGSGGGVSKSTTYSLTVTPTLYQIRFRILDDAGSPVSGATLVFAGSSYSNLGTTYVASGSYPLSTGNVLSGYRFKAWETSGGVSVSSPLSSSTTATVSESGWVAMRLQRVATVTFSVSGMFSDASGTVLTVNGTSYSYGSLPLSFTWDVGSTHSFTWTDYVSTTVTGKRYAWVSTSGLSTARSGSITVPSGGGSISATYKTQYYLTMRADPIEGGSVSPGSGWVDAVSSVLISATPSSGWAFERWTGSLSSTSNPTTITMNAPATAVANFYTFTVSVSPSSGSVEQGKSTSTTVTVSLTGGSGVTSKTISLTASGLPSGASASFSPSSVTVNPGSSAPSTMTITTSSSTPIGTYTITVTGMGGGLSKSTTYWLTITQPFDFSMSASPSTLSICRGASKTSTITVILVSGSPTTVTLEALSLPDGLSLSLSRTGGTPTFTSTLTITAPSIISLGTYIVYIQGGGGGKIKLTSINVYVNDWSISVSPSSGSVNVGGSATATVTVRSTSGSASSMTVSLSASNVPSGVTVSFSPSSVTVGAGSSATSTMTMSASSSATAGTYTIAITGSSDCGTSKSVSYTLTILVPVTFDAFKTSGARFNSKQTSWILYVDGSTYYYNQLPITFYWPVGSKHYITWYSGVFADESSYLSGTDARYDWSYSTGVLTSQSGYLTVPSSGGSVAAYYQRCIEVIVDKQPYNGGTVSRESGWYPEGTDFSATANYGYQFHHWIIKDNSEWTNTGNPISIWNPCYLTAVFYIRVTVYAYDSEYNWFPNIYVSCGGASGYTNSYGYVTLYVPYGYNTLSVSSSGSGYGGTSLPFWKWGDGTQSTSRTIYVYKSTSYTAYYKCALVFRNPNAEWRFAPGTGFSYIYRTWGYVDVVTSQSRYGKSGITVKAVWHIHKEDIFGSHYYTREGTGATDSNGYYDFEISSGFMGDFYLVSEDLWVEVSTQAGKGYVNAYWTKGDF